MVVFFNVGVVEIFCEVEENKKVRFKVIAYEVIVLLSEVNLFGNDLIVLEEL